MVNTGFISSVPPGIKGNTTPLEVEDIAQAILFALGTPDRVQVRSCLCQKNFVLRNFALFLQVEEIIIKPMHESNTKL